jgi:hypothetical protein
MKNPIADLAETLQTDSATLPAEVVEQKPHQESNLISEA